MGFYLKVPGDRIDLSIAFAGTLHYTIAYSDTNYRGGVSGSTIGGAITAVVPGGEPVITGRPGAFRNIESIILHNHEAELTQRLSMHLHIEGQVVETHLISCDLEPGQSLVYSTEAGFMVLRADGHPDIGGPEGPEGPQGPEGPIGDPWTFVRLGTNFTTNSNLNQPITGLVFTPEPDKTYLVYGVILTRTASAGVGPRPGIAWPTVQDAVAKFEGPVAGLAGTQERIWGARTDDNVVVASLADTTSSHWNRFEALIVAGSLPAGVFQVTLASETNGTTVTAMQGSFIAYREVATTP